MPALTAVLIAALMAGATAADAATPWGALGGDVGRSGLQTRDAGGTPLSLAWAVTSPTDAIVQTSPLITAGPTADDQLVVYGTIASGAAGRLAGLNGRVQLRKLSTGNPVGAAEGVLVDDATADPDVFGPGPGSGAPSSVSFVDTSTAAGPGQVFVVHNDRDQDGRRGAGDIAIAQVDEATGALVHDNSIAVTDGFSIASSVIAPPPDPSGATTLYFVAANGGGEQRLFRVPIAAASTINARVQTPTFTPDIDAEPQSSPSIVVLRDAANEAAAYIAIGTRGLDGPRLSLFDPNGVAGPVSVPLAGRVRTASVPVQSNGAPPGPGSPVPNAPAIYVASTTANGNTVVQRLVQSAPGSGLVVDAKSSTLTGAPAPALAANQLVTAAGLSSGARVVVTTGSGLYALRTSDLRVVGVTAQRLPGSTGFGQTTAAIGGRLIYVATDEGEQTVLRTADARPAGGFTEAPANGGVRGPDRVITDPKDPRSTIVDPADRLDRSGTGAPAVASGYVAFGGPRGLFAYRTTPVLVPAGAITATVTPKRDASGPRRFVIKGAVTPPDGMTPADACVGGKLSVTVRAGDTKLTTRTASLSTTCTYSATLTFSAPARFGRHRMLDIAVRFLGSTRLQPKNVAALRVAVR